MEIEELMSDMKKFDMLKNSKDAKAYAEKMQYLNSKIKKLKIDMENLNDIIKIQKKQMDDESSKLPKLENSMKKLTSEYESQVNVLKKLQKEMKKKRGRKSKQSIEEIAQAEERVNNSLKQQSELQEKINKIMNKREAIEARLKATKRKQSKSDIDLKSWERKQKEFKESFGKINKKPNRGLAGFSRDLSTMMFSFQTIASPLVGLINTLGDLEKKVTTLGVVSGKSGDEIKDLRSQLLKMSTDSIYSARQLSDSMEQIVRTGKTIEDAKNIVDKTVNLATASFESLSFATMTVNKAMVALGIESEDAGKVVNSFHNVVLSTPLDLRTLDESLRQTASAFGTIIKFSGRGGSELEDYRINVLDTVSALTGAMSLLGKTGLKYKVYVVQYKFL